MSDRRLPAYLSPNTAAALMGRSPRMVRRLLQNGMLRSEGRRWRKIRLSDLEAHIGRPVTLDDYMEADRRRDRDRAAARCYNENRKRNTSPVAGITTQPPKPHSLPGGSDNGVAFQRQDHGADAS